MIEFDLTVFDTVSLGTLTDALRCLDAKASIHFDFAHFRPVNLDSCRGYYEHLALGYGRDDITAQVLVPRLEEANGNRYDGYKGGQYTMSLDTPIWVANYRESGSTAIVGLHRWETMSVIVTRYVP